MPVLQFIVTLALFLYYLPPQPAQLVLPVVLFLVYSILLTLSLVFYSAWFRLFLVLLKILYCLLARLYFPWLVLLLLPLGPELYRLLPQQNGRVVLRIAVLTSSLAALVLLPGELLIPAVALWLFSAWLVWQEQRQAEKFSYQSGQCRKLRRQLAETERQLQSLARQGATREQLAKFQERQNISRALHDQLGHSFTGSIMQLEAAGLLMTVQPERAAVMVDRVVVNLREGLAAVRMSLKAILPGTAEQQLQEVRALLADFEADHARSASLLVEGDPQSISPAVWSIILANLREALTNMLRHSTGQHFQCTISVMNRLCKIEFLDDGIVSKPPRSGMGLEGMESRVRDAGGTMIVDNKQGFSIIMLFSKEGEIDAGSTAYTAGR